jgi:hypothetical protein
MGKNLRVSRSFAEGRNQRFSPLHVTDSLTGKGFVDEYLFNSIDQRGEALNTNLQQMPVVRKAGEGSRTPRRWRDPKR